MAAFSAAAYATAGIIGFIAGAPGWIVVVNDFISMRADNPGIRINRSFGHIQREVTKNIPE